MLVRRDPPSGKLALASPEGLHDGQDYCLRVREDRLAAMEVRQLAGWLEGTAADIPCDWR